MDKLASSMKKKYKNRLLNRENHWPPRHCNKLIRLELVEREKGESHLQRGRMEKIIKRMTLAYANLFKKENCKERVRKILVEGDAGIGKTTLSISLSEDWAHGELFQEFDLLLLLPLRQREIASASSLTELLKPFHSDPEVCESVARHLEKEEAEKVFIIADGWDELNADKSGEDSFLYQFLFKLFPLMSVVVTSRPSSSAPIRSLPCIDRFVEVNGFSKDDVKQYIQSEFITDCEKARRLLEQLEHNPLIESVCSVPLNCAIVCHLWHTLDEALPSTMTQLYTKLILLVVCRNLRKLEAYGPTFSLKSFSELPEDLQQSWWLLCQFACEALDKDKIVFSKKELLLFFPQMLAFDKNILCFGLLQRAEQVLDTDCLVSFNFVHLTFMEYLAALYLSKQPLNTWLQQLKKPRFTMVSRFLFGLCFSVLKNVSKDLDINQVLQCISDTGSFIKNKLALCHCAFEAQNRSIDDAVVHFLMECNPPYFGVGFGHPRAPHDCTAVLHVIENMQKCTGLKIDFSSYSISEKQIRTLSSLLTSKRQVMRLDLSFNKLTDKSVSELFQRASAAFESLKILYLDGNCIGAESIKSITTIFTNPSCTRYGLSLSDNPLRGSDLQIFKSAASECLLAELLWLDLSKSLPSDPNLNGPFVATLLAHCPHLESLNLSQNNLGSFVAATLAQGISSLQQKRPQFLSKLYLNQTNFSDEGMCTFVKNLESKVQIKELELRDNDIHVTGLSNLADAICSGKILIRGFYSNIDLSDNPLGIEGTKAVGRMLSSSLCQVRVVRLPRCELTNTKDDFSITRNLDIALVEQQLWQMPQNSIITSLDLDGNSFTGESVHILAGLMHLCTSLVYLSSQRCEINSIDLKKLLEKLYSSCIRLCTKLTSWNLCNNEIDDSGILTLVDYLPSLFPNVGHGVGGDIDLRNNPVSGEVEKLLKKRLRRGKQFPPESSGDENSREETSEKLFTGQISLSRSQCAAVHQEIKYERHATNTYSIKNQSTSQRLDQVLDSENGGVSKHLGQIADSMYEWEGSVAEHLSLTPAEIAAINIKYHGELRLQARAALEKWKEKFGSSATYGKLISVFELAGYQGYAETVHKILQESLSDQASSYNKQQ